MGLVSPGICGGVALIWSMSRARARATRGRGGRGDGDGDRFRGEGDEASRAADDGFAGDGAVFIVVARVGVELAG